jgi:hypothetical protein
MMLDESKGESLARRMENCRRLRNVLELLRVAEREWHEVMYSGIGLLVEAQHVKWLLIDAEQIVNKWHDKGEASRSDQMDSLLAGLWPGIPGGPSPS